MSAADWMRGNRTTQGSCLSTAERRERWLGLRLSTGVCLALVVTGLALRSAVVLLALVPIGALAAVGAILAAGATTAGLVLGGLLVAACATVTATNLCLPSEALALWERFATRDEVLTT